MKISSQRVCRLGFATILLMGLCWTGYGLVAVPARPYFQLDVVLSPEELADPQKQKATLELLKRAAGDIWLEWTVAGTMLVIVSAVGWVSAIRLDREASASSKRED